MVVPIPTRLPEASTNKVFPSMFKLFGIDTAVPLMVSVSPAALPRVVFPSMVRSEFPVMLPVTLRNPAMDVFSLMNTSPVLFPPRVSVWLAVGWRIPSAVR